MDNKTQRYHDERDRNLEKIAALKARNDALDRKIMETENLEIRAVMRSENITLDELISFARSMRAGQSSLSSLRRQTSRHDNPLQNTEEDDYE